MEPAPARFGVCAGFSFLRRVRAGCWGCTGSSRLVRSLRDSPAVLGPGGKCANSPCGLKHAHFFSRPALRSSAAQTGTPRQCTPSTPRSRFANGFARTQAGEFALRERRALGMRCGFGGPWEGPSSAGESRSDPRTRATGPAPHARRGATPKRPSAPRAKPSSPQQPLLRPRQRLHCPTEHQRIPVLQRQRLAHRHAAAIAPAQAHYPYACRMQRQ